MMRIIEPVMFGALALAGHLVVFGLAGADRMGDAGPAMPPTIDIAAAPVELAALVERWTEAPDVASEAPAMAMDLPPADPPFAPPLAPPITLSAPAAVTMPAVPGAVPTVTMDAPPVVDLAPAAVPAPAPKRVTTPVLAPAKADEKPARKAAAAPAKPKSDPQIQQASPSASAAASAVAGGGAGTKAMMTTWGKGIMAALARQSVRGRDMPRGTVTLALNIDTGGRLLSARVARSSGHAVLDQAALAAVGRVRFPAAPKGLPPGRHAFTLPVASR